MPTTTDHRPDDAVRANVPERRRSSILSAITIVVASISTLVILFLLLNSSSNRPSQVQSVPAQPNTVSEWVAAPSPEPPVALPPPAASSARTSAPASSPAAEPAVDELGFIDSEARCDTGQSAVAMARTQKSAVVVCRDADGDYIYQGVRLSDGASLRLDDVRPIPAGFEARNDGTTYRLSATELVVINGEQLHSRDAVVEYYEG